MSHEQLIHRTPADLIRTLKARAPFQLITIDGALSAGKTTLAELVATELSFVHIDLDDFVERQQGQFVAAMDFDALRDALASTDSVIMLSGICMMKVLAELNVAASVSIYVKRIGENGLWRDELEFDDSVLEQINEVIPDQADEVSLRAEVRAYHRSFNPTGFANIIYERFED